MPEFEQVQLLWWFASPVHQAAVLGSCLTATLCQPCSATPVHAAQQPVQSLEACFGSLTCHQYVSARHDIFLEPSKPASLHAAHPFHAVLLHGGCADSRCWSQNLWQDQSTKPHIGCLQGTRMPRQRAQAGGQLSIPSSPHQQTARLLQPPHTNACISHQAVTLLKRTAVSVPSSIACKAASRPIGGACAPSVMLSACTAKYLRGAVWSPLHPRKARLRCVLFNSSPSLCTWLVGCSRMRSGQPWHLCGKVASPLAARPVQASTLIVEANDQSHQREPLRAVTSSGQDVCHKFRQVVYGRVINSRPPLQLFANQAAHHALNSKGAFTAQQ